VLCAGDEEKLRDEERFLEFSSSSPEELLTSRKDELVVGSSGRGQCPMNTYVLPDKTES
jgi:hypothetical protein